MENSEWLKYKIYLREKLKLFSLKILELSDLIPLSTKGKVINYQLTKSGTSMYANYRAALRARLKAEFFSKLSIAVEEADETEMRIDILVDSKMLSGKLIDDIHTECIDLLSQLSHMRKQLGN